MAAGDETEWEFGWSQFKNATVASEASKLMHALACTNNTQLLERCASFHPLPRCSDAGKLGNVENETTNKVLISETQQKG